MSYINILAQLDTAAPAAAAPAEPVATTTQSTAVPATDPTPAPVGGDGLQMIVTFVLVGIVFYFLMIRPQMKQQKEAKSRQESLKAGDKIITNAGIHGIIREVQDKTVKVEVAANTVLKIDKGCVVVVLDKSGKGEMPANK